MGSAIILSNTKEHTKARKCAESGEDMEQYAIKSVAFGGFDKEDVARYIEKLSKEAEQSREELETLRRQAEQLTQEKDAMQAQLTALREEKERLAAERDRLAGFEAEAAALKTQLETLRPDAEAHAMLRDQVGTIECEARRRAAELEEQSTERMRRGVDLFRGQYQVLMDTFETAATHMTVELRKMEVSLAQLPRMMDQTGAELNTLASTLEKARPNQE